MILAKMILLAQDLWMLLALLGKANGGERTIGILGALYRALV